MAENQSTLTFGDEQTDLRSGIYAIRCIPTSKRYVGSAINFAVRWKAHVNALAANRHHSYRLQRAWNKYGPEAFAFEVIEHVEPERLVAREQFHIDAFRSAVASIGFNICPKAGSTLGVKLSEEHKAKLRARPISERTRQAVAEANRKRVHSAETRAKLAEVNRNRVIDDEFRRKVREGLATPEVRQRMSEAHKGMVQSEETRAKRSATLKGRTYTPETIEKMREAARNRKISEEGRKALAEGQRGRVHSDEVRAKISQANLGRHINEEAREKMRAAWVRRKARAVATKAEDSSTPA